MSVLKQLRPMEELHLLHNYKESAKMKKKTNSLNREITKKIFEKTLSNNGGNNSLKNV